MAVDWGDKNCSSNIIKYFKAFSTTINIVQPMTCNIRFGLYENDNISNKNPAKLEPYKALFEISAADIDQKKHNNDVYNSSSNFIDSQCFASNVLF